MGKLTSKREKGRAWTASTFLPDSSAGGSHPMDMSTNLDAISENVMDEDQDDPTNNQNILLNAAGLIDEDSSDSDNSSDNSDGAESDEETGDQEDNHDHEDEDDDDDEDDEESNQNHSDEDDSDEDSETQADEGTSDRLDVPKRSCTGLAAKSKKSMIATLSTSPSNTSKVVSATPTKKITKKSKKTVKTKGSKGCLSTAAARQATEEAKLEAAKPIVSRFLELENTKLNDKLLQVFMINGMLPYVIESITRLGETAKEPSSGMDVDVNQETRFMAWVKQCNRKRDYSNLDLMKKSYTAMNFITRSDVYNEFILSSGHQVIVRELFKIFRPESDGNFYHFQKVFETILKRFMAQTMTTLFEDVDSETGQAKTPLIFDMLPFLDQPPIALCMVKILFPTYTYGFSVKILDYYKILQEGHFLERLLAMVTMSQEPSADMGDFVVSLLYEATRAKEAKIMFTCLADDSIWAERLAQGVQSTSAVRRHSCIEIIYSILVRSIQMPFQDLFANSVYITERSFDRVESHLERIANEFGNHLAVHIPDLCRAFVQSKSNGEQVSLPGYTVPSSFTVARLWLLDSIYHCLNDVKDNPLLLESIPEVFWSTLTDSFFQFRFNNAFHVHFYKMFRVVLYSEQSVVYDRFFVRTNFLTRLIDHYRATDQPTGSRGYIILILNCIRLSAEVEAQRAENEDGKDNVSSATAQEGIITPTFWSDTLRAHSEWDGFKNTLREATLEQTRDTLYDMDPNLRFQFAPLQSRQPTEAPMIKRHIGIPSISARGNNGIDLGSRYGNSLGFGVPMKYDRAADEQAKEQAEQEQELEIQKATANLMPSLDWKLIPPRSILDALSGIKQPPAAKTKQGVNGKSLMMPSTETKGPNPITTGQESESNSFTKDAAASGNTKSKKKKKNKKKRQISSVNSDDPCDQDDSTARASRTNGSSSEHMSNDSDSSQTHAGAGDSEGSNKETGTTGESTAAEEVEEERRARKREKKREKKRKSKMNKKNRTSLIVDSEQESSSEAMLN